MFNNQSGSKARGCSLTVIRDSSGDLTHSLDELLQLGDGPVHRLECSVEELEHLSADLFRSFALFLELEVHAPNHLLSKLSAVQLLLDDVGVELGHLDEVLVLCEDHLDGLLGGELCLQLLEVGFSLGIG